VARSIALPSPSHVVRPNATQVKHGVLYRTKNYLQTRQKFIRAVIEAELDLLRCLSRRVPPMEGEGFKAKDSKMERIRITRQEATDETFLDMEMCICKLAHEHGSHYRIPDHRCSVHADQDASRMAA
jgi:hypothetical protein